MLQIFLEHPSSTHSFTQQAFTTSVQQQLASSAFFTDKNETNNNQQPTTNNNTQRKMPKSKREKIVSLTKTKKKSTLNRKSELIDSIRDCVNQYQYVYVFDLANCRSQHVKDVRSQLSDSRIFMTKNKVMSKALGEDEATEAADNIHKVSPFLTGLCALMFTNRAHSDIVSFFNKYEIKDYARSGSVATESITIPAGPIEWMPHSMEELLVGLGLPVELKAGVVHLRYEHVVCKKGETLTPDQCKILKHFGHQLSSFKMVLKCMWSKNNATFQKIN